MDHYVIVLCARQLCQEISRDYLDYWSAHSVDINALEERFAPLTVIRQRLIENSGELAEFLDWFDRWFLRRAVPVEEVEA